MFSLTLLPNAPAPCLLTEGRLDAIHHPQFDQELQALVTGAPVVVLDLSLCEYLASSAIRSFMVAGKKCTARGGALLLAGLQPRVQEVIEMTGLHLVFKLFANREEAFAEASRILGVREPASIVDLGGFRFRVTETGAGSAPAFTWNRAGIAGYNELGIALGIGSPAGTLAEESGSEGLFLALGNAAGFVPDDPGQAPDFRVVRDAAEGGIFVSEALSFGLPPSKYLEPADDRRASLGTLQRLLQDWLPDQRPLFLLIADRDPHRPSLTGLTGDRGITFLLSQLPDYLESDDLSDFLREALTIESVESVDQTNRDLLPVQPRIWLFAPDRMEDAFNQRIRVEQAGGEEPEAWKIFVARRLYTDSRKIVLKPLHGGYSAQTFQVESFDPQGRRLRPTVLKIGSRAIIARESERCRQYAMPFILNNSAQVLGTVFYADQGALRYNFVGIGGTETRLLWLTHLFNEWPADQLEPVFDKIFTRILNPWYGQPVKMNIFPYRDHDPRAVFFKNLCETAESVLNIPTSQPMIDLPETGRQTVNPYWFLKHRFEERIDWSMEYYTSICHGDLNMQNILLDQDMNIYLIDFSETRPRSVISDFARLEAIFMIEHAAVNAESDRIRMAELLEKVYRRNRLDELLDVRWDGGEAEKMNRNLAMIRKMRQYALHYTDGDPDCRPYYLALLEWILPIVCYTGAPLPVMRLSAIAAANISEML